MRVLKVSSCTVPIFLTFLGILAAITHAQSQACTGDKSIIGYCSITSFEDVTASKPDPPTITQCENTCRNILTDLGDWGFTLNDNTIHTVAYSACSFRVGRVNSTPNPFTFSMHNQDIVDIIGEVNLRYGSLHKGKVAAEGTMVCEGQPVKWYVN